MPDSAPIIVFWCTLALMAYTLKGYPLLLRILAPLKKERQIPDGYAGSPRISFIVSAYNEEENISDKLENLAQVDYDPDKIEFIIGSDGSTDGTDRTLAEAASRDNRVRYFRLEKRSGKIEVLKQAVELASGSVLVFTDASVRTRPDILSHILPCLADPKIGLVSSRDVWINEQSQSPAQNAYIDYEMNIRRMESRLNSLVSVSGSFFAVRKELFRPYGSDQADDFALPLLVYRQGYRVIHCDDLIGYVPMVKSAGAELHRRTRIIQAGIRTVAANPALLNPFRYPVFAWQLWSHKVLKWVFPFVAMANFVMAILLWNQSLFYRIWGGLWLALPAGGLLGMALTKAGFPGNMFRKASFFLLSIVAALRAWLFVVTGTKMKTWEPSHR